MLKAVEHINNKIFTKKRFWAAVLVAQFLLFFVFSKIAFFVQWFERFFEFQKTYHQRIFSVFQFSAGDVLYVILGIVFLFFLYNIFKKSSRNSSLLKFLMLLNALYFVYQLFWGMLYFQKPLIEKLPEGEITLEETKSLTLKYLNLCKETRKWVSEDKNGVFKIRDVDQIKKEILHHQKQLPTEVNLKKATTFNTIKPSLYKGIMSYSGIYGYYNPFTAEAQYNADLPSSSLPFTMAHESAHQLGYAREQEANFIGYLIGKNSKNNDLKYSTQYFVLRSLLNSLVEKNPQFVQQVLENYSDKMKRDRAAEKQFRLKHEGFLDAFFGYTNDLFLKSNQQEGSITYSYFVDLLVRYERIREEIK